MVAYLLALSPLAAIIPENVNVSLRNYGSKRTQGKEIGNHAAGENHIHRTYSTHQGQEGRLAVLGAFYPSQLECENENKDCHHAGEEHRAIKPDHLTHHLRDGRVHLDAVGTSRIKVKMDLRSFCSVIAA